MAITNVTANNTTVTGTSSNPSLTLPNTPAQGNLLIASLVTINSVVHAIPGWTELPTNSPATQTGVKVSYFYKIAGASESKIITPSSISLGNWRMCVAEWNDSAGGTWTLDVSAQTLTASGSVANSGTTATTTQANEVWITVIAAASVRTQGSPTNGFTLITGGGPIASGYMYHKIVSATGAASTSVTLVSGNAASAGIIATWYALPPITPKSSSDSGSGADTQSLSVARVFVTSADTGSGVDIGVPRARVASAQTGAGTDTQLVVVGRTFKTSSDAGSGTDTGVPRARVTSADGAALDPYTVLLIHADGTDTSTTFVDSSPAAHSIVAIGNAQVDTALSKFGGASLLCDNGGAISSADHADFKFIGDWTIDFQVAIKDNTVAGNICTKRVAGGTGPFTIYQINATIYFYAMSAAQWDVASAIPFASGITPGVMHHLEVCRSGNTFYGFWDGTQVFTFTDSRALYNNTEPISFGGSPGTGEYSSVWLDEMRVSKGIARHTSNFTPPTAPYTLGVANGSESAVVFQRTSKASSDSGSGTDSGIPRARVASSQTATGADTQVAAVGQTFKTSSDAGVGADAILKRKTQVLDVGTGVETHRRAAKLTDVGSGADTQVVRVRVVSADVGAGADTQRKTAKQTDVGAGSDTQALKVKSASADTGVGTETSKRVARLTDVGSGADTQVVKVRVVSADTGSGVDAILKRKTQVLEVGAGADTQTTGVGVVTRFGTDAGSGTDSVLKRKVVSADSCGGVDSGTVAVGVVPKTSSDAGSGTETQVLVVGRVFKTSSDAGTGVDAPTKLKRQFADVGSGVDAQLLKAKPTSNDSGVGTETQRAIKKVTDVGSGVEAQLVRVRVTSSDAGVGSETATGKIRITSADAGAGTDAIIKRKTQVPDSGSGADAVTKRKIVSFDTGAGTQTQNIQLPGVKTGVQSGVGVDTAVVKVKLASAQVGAGAETYALVAKLTSAQVGSGSETAVIPKRAFGSVQLGNGAETQTIKARVTSSDVSSGADTVLRKAKFASFDTGVGTETAVQTHAVNADLTCNFKVRVLTHADLVATFIVVSANRADLVVTYNIGGTVHADLTCVYALTGPVRTDLVVVYQIFGAAAIITGIITRQHGAVAQLEQVLNTEGLIRRAATGKAEIEQLLDTQGIITRAHPARVKERIYA